LIRKYVLKEFKRELLKRTSLQDLNEDHKYPLEDFDDPSFEIHTPEEWLKTAKTEEGVRAYSRYYHYNDGKLDWDWLPCLVKSYNSETKLFAIEWYIHFLITYSNNGFYLRL
jgi:hypothetical protein